MPSEEFLARNPHYRQRQVHPTAKRGPDKIHGFAGLNQFYAQQDRGRPTTEDPRRPGVSASEVARRASNQMIMLGPDGKQVADSTRNRTNPNRFGPSGGRAMQSNPHLNGNRNRPMPGPTPQQREWADKAAAQNSGAAAAARGGVDAARAAGGAMSNPVGAIREAAEKASSAMNKLGPASNNPYSGTREQNVANAKTAGAFPAVQKGYNEANAQRGFTMDGDGGIKKDDAQAAAFNRSQLQPAADEIAARRDFNRGEAPLARTGTFTNNDKAPGGLYQESGYAEKANPYGTASATYGNTTPQGQGGMMPNPGSKGGQMPVAQFNQEQSAVQDSKFGPMPQGLPPSSSASTTQPNPYMTGTGGSLTPATPQGGPAQTPPATQVKGGVTGGVKPDPKTAAETSVDSSMADDLNSAVSSMPNKNKNKRPV